MNASYFVYLMMALNTGAAMAYLWQGNSWKALYWAAAFTLNLCILNLK